ncbi:MAG: galactose-1-phosphate uridylyltransferase [Actinobacteria bacterium]|nr:galactose-1-phosphate uridylyltransferase [Actinomycetota bacterium]
MELRWDPLLRTWVMMAASRQERPFLPEGQCPFCPGSGKVPDSYDILAYDNDFPALVLDPPAPDIAGDDLIPVRPSLGKCEVTLYSPRHEVTLPGLPPENVVRLVEHWRERYRELGEIPGVEYVFIFENRGEAVGVTIHHPHGQIYAYPFVPLRVRAELESSLAHREERGSCLICDILRHESADGRRMVHRGDGFTAFVPPWAQYGYDVMVVSDRHLGSLTDLDAGEVRGLAEAIRCVAGGYDSLFGFTFPYMMCMHQVPTDGGDHSHYHFHVEFYPPMRDRDKLKYSASSETGAWAHINTTVPEEKAAELRAAVERYRSGQGRDERAESGKGR